MEKSLVALKITLLVILISILVGVLIVSINKDFTFETKSKLVYDKNIEEDFSKIDSYLESMDIRFVKSDDNKTNVKVYDKKENNVTFNVENDTLKIVSDNNEKCIFCISGGRKIVISLPEKIYDLKVETKSGDIASSINFNKVSIDSKSGDIKLNNISDVDIKVKSGDISLNNIKNGDIKVASGDIEVEEADDIKITSTSGDVQINKINKYLDIDTKSGDISISDLALTKNSKIKVTSGDVFIYKASNDIYFNAKVASGDVMINNNNRHANNELTISTKSGDITVEN